MSLDSHFASLPFCPSILTRNRLAFYGPRVCCPERKDPFGKSVQDLDEIIHAIQMQGRNSSI